MASNANSSELKATVAKSFEGAMLAGREWQKELAACEEWRRPIVLAQAVETLRSHYDKQAMQAVRQLAGSQLGFKTDRDDYSDDVIRDCVICAQLNKEPLSIVGNEFNIIAGDMFPAKNGWTARLQKLGCYAVDPNVGKPENVIEGSPNTKGFRRFSAVFAASASCKLRGVTWQVTATLTDDADYRLDADAWGKDLSDAVSGMKGKIEARILRKLYHYVADIPDESDEAAVNTVTVADAKVIEVAPVVETVTNAMPTSPADWDRYWKSMSERGDKIDERTLQIARALRAAPSKEMLVVAMIEADADRDKIDDANYEMLRSYYQLLDGMLIV